RSAATRWPLSWRTCWTASSTTRSPTATATAWRMRSSRWCTPVPPTRGERLSPAPRRVAGPRGWRRPGSRPAARERRRPAEDGPDFSLPLRAGIDAAGFRRTPPDLRPMVAELTAIDAVMPHDPHAQWPKTVAARRYDPGGSLGLSPLPADHHCRVSLPG